MFQGSARRTASVVIPEYPLYSQGKVRDMYDLGDSLLMIASDRVSAFDVVLPTEIVGKGALLTQISKFWFQFLQVPNHLVTTEVAEFPASLHPYRAQLQHRSMQVKKANRFDVECIARGYLTGSGWKEYQATGSLCGQTLPKGLKQCQQLATPLFTPSTKASDGHDQNISFAEMCDIVGEERAIQLRDMSLQIYERARQFACRKGILIADTKFEFGEVDGEVLLIDEVLTPDSSRFWPAEEYEVGQDQPSFDKQIIRNYLEGIDWDKREPGPELPPEVVEKSIQRYREVYHRLTGKEPE